MVKDCASFKVPSIIYILGTRSLVDYRGTITFAGKGPKIPFRCRDFSFLPLGTTATARSAINVPGRFLGMV